MKTLVLEVRDTGTHIPVLAIKFEAKNEIEKYYFQRCGANFDGKSGIMVMNLHTAEAKYDPYGWRNGYFIRTLFEAHKYIAEYFEELKDGDVVDVEYILDETQTKKKSERFNK